jgi:hypothetical protein
MTLTEEQKAAVLQWIADGAGPADLQKRLKEEFQLSLTYLETRLLADDLKAKFVEPEPPPAPAETPAPEPEKPVPTGKVSVTIDQITRPGAMISGRVTFSDGENAGWYLDPAGRLALDPSTPGYRPSQKDVMDFQIELEKAARSQGL